MPRGAATKVPKVLDIGMRVAATAAKALGNAARQEFGEEADTVMLRGEITGKRVVGRGVLWRVEWDSNHLSDMKTQDLQWDHTRTQRATGRPHPSPVAPRAPGRTATRPGVPSTHSEDDLGHLRGHGEVPAQLGRPLGQPQAAQSPSSRTTTTSEQAGEEGADEGLDPCRASDANDDDGWVPLTGGIEEDSDASSDYSDSDDDIITDESDDDTSEAVDSGNTSLTNADVAADEDSQPCTAVVHGVTWTLVSEQRGHFPSKASFVPE